MIIAVRRESPSGGMKSILAVRQRKKINYPREAKRKLISPRGGANEINYRHEAKKKSIIALRRRKSQHRREAQIAV